MLTKRTIIFVSLVSLILTALLFRNSLVWSQASAAKEQAGDSIESIPGLRGQVTVVRDIYGVPHVKASSDRDAYFMMGYLHAEDRFFQMDISRRQGSGTLAEILGAGPNDQTLWSDVNAREFGLRRAAERSLAVYTPEVAALIRAYSDGVNAWLDTKPLPPEHKMLEITHVPRWTPVDSITILKNITLTLSFDKDDMGRATTLSDYQSAGKAKGFDGTKLYFEDIYRVAPFDPVAPGPPRGVSY